MLGEFATQDSAESLRFQVAMENATLCVQDEAGAKQLVECLPVLAEAMSETSETVRQQTVFKVGSVGTQAHPLIPNLIEAPRDDLQ